MTLKTNNRRNSVSIIVPTFKRPNGIKTALKSVESQQFSGFDCEVIIVDNDPKASARSFVKTYAKTSTLDIKYQHEPNPGVANARNLALKIARGRYIVFLDDDQEALPNWLSEILSVAQTHKAALVFGPCIAMVKTKSKFHDYYQNYFSRNGKGLKTGLIDDVFGCGNSLIDTQLCTLPSPPFDASANEIGGEDDLLFTALQRQNIRIAWAANANVYEHVPPSRSTPKYIKTRSFAYGQSPSEQCADSKPRDYSGIIKWMGIGCVQYCMYTPLAIFTKIIGHPSYIKYLGKSAEGAGKIFWAHRYAPKLYGQ